MRQTNHFIIAVGLLFALSANTHIAHAQGRNMQEKVKNYFLQTLKTKQDEELKSKEAYQRNRPYTTSIQQVMKANEIAENQKMVWTALKREPFRVGK